MASIITKVNNSNYKGHLSSLSIHEKASTSKRKFRPDPRLNNPNKVLPPVANDKSNNESPSEKFDLNTTPEDPPCPCEMCGMYDDNQSDSLKLDLEISTDGSSEYDPCRIRQDWINESFEDPDWNELTESQLEELVLTTLDAIFKSAINIIVSSGYSEEVATNAILRSALCSGPKDTVSNVVEHALVILRNGKDSDSSNERCFRDLGDLGKYLLAELVCVIREVRPFFSNGDAMWCLLVCDMNVSHACAMDADPLSSMISDGLHICPPESKTKPSSKKKPFVVKKTNSTSLKREYTIHQKFEKTCTVTGIKGTFRAAKLSGYIVDKRGKPVSNSVVSLKTSSGKITKTISKETNSSNSSNTELSLSLSRKRYNEALNPNYYTRRANKKDEMIIKLLPRVHELESQIEDWTEWTNRKVMQAAKRLGKDKAELKMLKQEKEEMGRVKNDNKQSLKDNTVKKLCEMENALGKASDQIQEANDTVRRLEVENASLKNDLVCAKLRVVECSASCEEDSKREKETVMKFQLWVKEKGVFQEELAMEKRKFSKLQLEVKDAESVHTQLLARWKQEEKTKHELQTQANTIKKEREQLEASSKSKEDSIRQNAESKLQEYKENISKLENELSQLRQKTDSSKIAALKKVQDYRAQDFSDNGGVKRDRECVMCLSEEMSVVFLPCAHQVVCRMCNDLHEKQGMNECPSCRSAIVQRISVRYYGRS